MPREYEHFATQRSILRQFLAVRLSLGANATYVQRYLDIFLMKRRFRSAANLNLLGDLPKRA